MVKTTRAQRVALKAVFDRAPLFLYPMTGKVSSFAPHGDEGKGPLTYQQFRKTIQPTFGCDGAVMVQWCGMWLGIEADGYTHS